MRRICLRPAWQRVITVLPEDLQCAKLEMKIGCMAKSRSLEEQPGNEARAT